jgi:DNA-binding beta-propeller fold protein YncE
MAAITGAGLPGCGSAPGEVFDSKGPVRVWPAPPDEARIRYVGELRTSADLKPGRSFGEGVGEFLFGKDAVLGMLSPMGVCTDGKERVFVADSNAQVVHVFDLGTRVYARWAPPGRLPGFGQPVAVAFDPYGGRVLVSDSVGGVVETFDLAGVYKGPLGAGVLKRPCGVAVDGRNGRVFVVDVVAHQVVVFDSAGAEIARVGGRGSGLGEFNYPTNVALDAGGRMYVSDTLNFRVQEFDSELRPIRQIGRKGDMPGYFSQPKGISVDAEGHVFVVDANFEAVQVFDAEGQLLMTFGREGQGPGEFWLPAGICADAQGRVWVADTYNKRVEVFETIAGRKTP